MTMTQISLLLLAIASLSQFITLIILLIGRA